MNNTNDLPDFAKKELEKVNAFWQEFVSIIPKNNHEPRITSIVFQIMFEYYVDRILMVLQCPIKNLRYDEKLEYLKELRILRNDFVDDLLILYDIRNIYAHELTVAPKRIKNKLNAIKHIRFANRRFQRLENKQHYFELGNICIRGLQRIFLTQLIKRIENFQSNNLDDQFRKMFQ